MDRENRGLVIICDSTHTRRESGLIGKINTMKMRVALNAEVSFPVLKIKR